MSLHSRSNGNILSTQPKTGGTRKGQSVVARERERMEHNVYRKNCYRLENSNGVQRERVCLESLFFRFHYSLSLPAYVIFTMWHWVFQFVFTTCHSLANFYNDNNDQATAKKKRTRIIAFHLFATKQVSIGFCFRFYSFLFSVRLFLLRISITRSMQNHKPLNLVDCWYCMLLIQRIIFKLFLIFAAFFSLFCIFAVPSFAIVWARTYSRGG